MKCMILKSILKCKPPQNFEFPGSDLSSVYSVLLFYFLWPAAAKTFKKHKYTPTRTIKELILHRFLDENTLVFYPLALLSFHRGG